MLDRYKERKHGEAPHIETEELPPENVEEEQPVVETKPESAPASIPEASKPEEQAGEPTPEKKVDLKKEIGNILQEGDKVKKLIHPDYGKHSDKLDILRAGALLRDSIYRQMGPPRQIDGTDLARLIFEWLSQLGLDEPYTKTEARNRATKILELYP